MKICENLYKLIHEIIHGSSINLPACPSVMVKNAVKWFLNIEIWFFENLETDLWESWESWKSWEIYFEILRVEVDTNLFSSQDLTDKQSFWATFLL